MSFEFIQLDTAWVWLGLLGGHSQCWEKLVVHRNILSLSYHQGLPRVTRMIDFNSQSHVCTNQESNPGQILRHDISVTSVTGWTQPVLREFTCHTDDRFQKSKPCLCQQGIKPRANAWRTFMLPLHYWHYNYWHTITTIHWRHSDASLCLIYVAGSVSCENLSHVNSLVLG